MKTWMPAIAFGQLFFIYHSCFGQIHIPPVGEGHAVGPKYTAPSSNYERPQSHSSSTAFQQNEEQLIRERKEAQWRALDSRYVNAANKRDHKLAIQILKEMKLLYPNDGETQRSLDQDIAEMIRRDNEQQYIDNANDGYNALKNGNWRYAITSFKTALAYAPDNKRAEIRRYIAEAEYYQLLDAGKIAENQRNVSFALVLYEQAIQTRDANAVAVDRARGIVEKFVKRSIERKEYDEAIKDVKKMINYRPSDDQAKAYQTDIKRLAGWQRAEELMKDADKLLKDQDYVGLVRNLKEAVLYESPDVEIMRELLEHARQAMDEASSKAITIAEAWKPTVSNQQPAGIDKNGSTGLDFIPNGNLPPEIADAIGRINRQIGSRPSPTAPTKVVTNVLERLSPENRKTVERSPETKNLLNEWRLLVEGRRKDLAALDEIEKQLQSAGVSPDLKEGLKVLQKQKKRDLQQSEQLEKAKGLELDRACAKVGIRIDRMMEPETLTP